MNGVWDALAAIFICLLPNLLELSLVDFGDGGQHLFMETVLLRAAILQENPDLITPEASQIRAGLHRYAKEKGGIEGRVKFSNDISQGSTMPLEFALSKLQRVSISSESTDFPWTGVDPVQTLPYLALPSVTSFSAHKLLDNFDTDDPRHTAGSSYEYPLPDFNFKTTELVLTHSLWRVMNSSIISPSSGSSRDSSTCSYTARLWNIETFGRQNIWWFLI